MTSVRRVLIAADSGPGIGGGHVLRCLSLATALVGRGAQATFAVGETGRALVERFAEAPVAVAPTADFSAVLRAAEGLRPDAVVLDHYGWGAAEGARVAPFTRCVTVIDDLADRALACDLLIDPGFGRKRADYGGLVPQGARLLLGPDFALLRPAFAGGRAGAFEPVRARIERVFVSFGLSDVSGIAARAVELIRRALPDAELDVAIAGDADSLPSLQRRAEAERRLRLHVDATDVAGLLAAADLAVGAGGSATWERCCLGAPTLGVVVADNQRALLTRLDAAGVLVACDLHAPGFKGAFEHALTRLQDPGLRARLRETSRSLCDGLGAERAADALLSRLDEKG